MTRHTDPYDICAFACTAEKDGRYTDAAKLWDAYARSLPPGEERDICRAYADACRDKAQDHPRPMGVGPVILTIQVCGKCEMQLGWFVGTRSVSRLEAARFLAMEDTRLRASHGYCRDRACLPAWMAALEEEELRAVCGAGDERAVEGTR